MPPRATTTEGPTNNAGTRTSDGMCTASNNVVGLARIFSQPIYSFSSDASQEFQRRLGDLTQRMATSVDNTLLLGQLGGDSHSPFSSTRDGDKIHLMYPMNVKQGDLLAALITALAASIPTCIIHESSAGWSEPDWSTESRKHLAGLFSGIQETPRSFSHTSSPTDLARISIWITACAAALSRPGGVASAQGDVLPTVVGGQKSASKYLSRVLAGLRANINDDSCLKSIETLSTLLKLWQRENYENALSIVRKCKIPWSAVLFRAAPTETIKGKRNKPDQTVIRSPPKPSRSPWLSAAERSELGTLFKDKWSFLENYRSRFAALEPEQQHRQFTHFIKEIKLRYEELTAISNSVHAKLGKRKYWIERVCKQDKYNPKVKKGESESFLLSAHFFKKDLTAFSMQIKKVFSPLTYLDEKPFRSESIWQALFPEDDDSSRISSADFALNSDGPAYRLWQIWADVFLPVFYKTIPKVEDAPQLEEFNMYSGLPEKEA